MQDENEPKDEPVKDREALDAEAEKELAGVPEHLRDQSEDEDDADNGGDLSEALESMKADLDTLCPR